MTQHNKHYDVLILGGGAAGLMCAIEAGKRGRSIALIEHNDRVGKKIRIAGGGRCNFTNVHTSSANYISHNAHFCKSALARFTPEHFINLIDQYKIQFHEKKLGQLFCDDSAQQVIDMLIHLCHTHHIDIYTNTSIIGLKKEDTFILNTCRGIYTSDSVVVATGGLSIPPLGATDLGYNIARQFGINIKQTYAGLVPFTLHQHDQRLLNNLSGISVDVIISCGNVSFRENILFTHKGLSGPAILQISSYWKPQQKIFINLFPDEDIESSLKNDAHQKTTLKKWLKQKLPARFVDQLCEHYLNNKPLNQYHDQDRRHIAQSLHQWTITPSGTEGYSKAEVTIGGIDTLELSSKTMESKKQPGLYFIGEVVDVTGQLGGFNFQWAWSSGHAAGQHV